MTPNRVRSAYLHGKSIDARSVYLRGKSINARSVYLRGKSIDARSVYLYGSQILKTAGIESHLLDAQLLLMFVLDRDKTWLLGHPEHIVDDDSLARFNELIEKRAHACPVAYITNNREFFGLDFYVDERALIPRPETEHVVEAAVSALGDSNAVVLDIGTGSGCIAVAIAKLCNAQVVACDISDGALAVAKKNTAAHGVSDKITFIQADAFDDGSADAIRAAADGTIDMIISNPPYIETDDIATLPDTVKHYEPLTALDGGADGLIFYRRIAELGISILPPGGVMILETGAGQAGAVSAILNKNTYTNIHIIKDLAGIDRVVKCTKEGTHV